MERQFSREGRSLPPAPCHHADSRSPRMRPDTKKNLGSRLYRTRPCRSVRSRRRQLLSLPARENVPQTSDHAAALTESVRPIVLEHEPHEVLLDQVRRPGEPRRPQVLQVVVAVRVHEVELSSALSVRFAPALCAEPLVEHEVVLLDALRGVSARPLAPDDQCPAVVRKQSLYRPEPPRTLRGLPEPAFDPQTAFGVPLELSPNLARRPKPRDAEPEQPVERLDQIDGRLAALVRTRPFDSERIRRRVGEPLHVEERARFVHVQ